MAIQWKPGTGEYIGDRTAYVVVDEENRAFMTFWLGGIVGHSTRRHLELRDHKLVVQASRGLPELVLEDGMSGFWEASGAEIYRAELPPRPAPPPGRKAVTLMGPAADWANPAPPQSSDLLVGTALVPPKREVEADAVADRDALPSEAGKILKRVFREYDVRRGPAGIVILRKKGERKYVAPDDLQDVFGTFLERPHRYPLLRALRNSEASQELEKLDVAPLPRGVQAVPERSARRSAGWYAHAVGGDEPDKLICALDNGFYLRVLRTLHYAVPMLGSSLVGKTLLSVTGVVATGAQVFTRAGGDSEFDLLVCCSQGKTQDVGLVITARSSANTSEETLLLAYHIEHQGSEIKLVSAREASDRLSFFAVTDKEGKQRFFRKF